MLTLQFLLRGSQSFRILPRKLTNSVCEWITWVYLSYQTYWWNAHASSWKRRFHIKSRCHPGTRCSAEPLSSCNCEGCRCIHDVTWWAVAGSHRSIGPAVPTGWKMMENDGTCRSGSTCHFKDLNCSFKMASILVHFFGCQNGMQLGLLSLINDPKAGEDQVVLM